MSAVGRNARTSDDFARLVARYGRLDPDLARPAADAVLDALGERLTSGEVEDLAAMLPEDLARALKRGDARSKGAPRPLGLIEFERRIADRESVTPEEARRHARAVLAALREAVGDKEFSDALAQLPRQFRVLLEDDTGEPAAPAADADADAEPPPAPGWVELHAPSDLPPGEAAEARALLGSIERYTDQPILGARLTLRPPETRKARMRWIADASVSVDGRTLAAHTTGKTAIAATNAAVNRLRRQLRRVVGQEVALRNEPRVLAKELTELAHVAAHRPERHVKAPSERRIVHRRRVPDVRTSTLDAVTEMLDADQEFRLFRHESTGEWLALYRREDGRVGLIHPRWVPIHDRHDDVVVIEPSAHSEPVTLEQARAELEAGERRFLFFVDADDGQPRILYLRHDGDYGLVEPEVPRVT
jgi:uncharacterized protein (DUF2267 family)/ribosome-associated translation inhibitor RaiA